jgi:hypothetical protein
MLIAQKQSARNELGDSVLKMQMGFAEKKNVKEFRPLSLSHIETLK